MVAKVIFFSYFENLGGYIAVREGWKGSILYEKGWVY